MIYEYRVCYVISAPNNIFLCLTFVQTNYVVLVMYIVDLRRGIYYQKCYDPDCRGVYTILTHCLGKQYESKILFLKKPTLSADYRSPIRPVPDSYLPEDMVYYQGATQNLCDNLYSEGECHVDKECDPDSAASRGSWWLEAVKVADDLESKPKTLEPLTWVS